MKYRPKISEIFSLNTPKYPQITYKKDVVTIVQTPQQTPSTSRYAIQLSIDDVLV